MGAVYGRGQKSAAPRGAPNTACALAPTAGTRCCLRTQGAAICDMFRGQSELDAGEA